MAWAFPTRERIAAAAESEIREVGFSTRKAEYVTALARSELDLAALSELPDEQVIEAITAQRGLGRWSADWFLARALGRPDGWPAGDLGVRKAVSFFYGSGRDLDETEVRDGGRTIRAMAQHRLPHAARRGEVARMTVRSATLDDLPVLEELWRAFEAEVPPPAHEEVDLANELAEIRAIVESGLGWLAEEDGAAVGMVLARRRGPRVGRITDLYVRPAARRAGVAQALVRDGRGPFAADGVDTIDLEVMASNTAARAAYARFGFRDEVLVLAAPVAALADRLGEPPRSLLVRLDPRADRRRRRDPEGGRDVRAAAAGTLARLDRDPAPGRLRHRLRRRLRPRPGDAAPAREGALVAHRARRDHASASRRRRSCG